jgi:energy-coupling factor transport system substrate-specific component
MSWALASALVLALALGGGFWWFERSRPPARMLALVATMAALSGLGRVAFVALPSVKPTTAMVLVCGVALGAAPGFAIGALAALSSNVFLGQGPWTPWQMAAWGAVGVAGALLGRIAGREPSRLTLAIVAAVCAAAFSEILNLSLVSFGGGPVLSQWALWAARGVPFDVTHTVSSFLFASAFGPELLRALRRFRLRQEFRWTGGAATPTVGSGLRGPEAKPDSSTVPPGLRAGAAVGLVLAALALALAGGALARPATAAAATTPTGYLLAAQNSDGGFGAAAGQPSSALFSAWAALGLAASGHNPADVARGGASALAAVRSQARALTGTGDLERTLLVLRAAGSSTRVAGRDLLATLVVRQRPDGSFGEQVNLTAFGVYVLRGFGRLGAATAGARWIVRQQDGDGGFNFAGRGPISDVDDTGAALEALAAGRDAPARTVKRALAFLHASQNPDGGFPADGGEPSNAQSTAFAVQGLLAVGAAPARFTDAGASPLAYLRSLIAPDGSVRYSRTSGQTPVWVTGQALLALAGRPFPLAAVPRAKRGGRSGPAGRRGSAASTTSGPSGRRGRPSPVATPGASSWPLGAGLDPLAYDAGLVSAYLIAPILSAR